MVKTTTRAALAKVAVFSLLFATAGMLAGFRPASRAVAAVGPERDAPENGGLQMIAGIFESTLLPSNISAIDVAADGTIFLSENHFLRSLDGGRHWHYPAAGTGWAYALDVSPNYAQDKTLFKVTSVSGVYFSTDRGETWQWPSDPLAYALDVVASPNFANDDTVFAITGQWPRLVARSTDGGDDWTDISPPGLQIVWALAVSDHYASDQTIFIGGPNYSVQRSTNGGSSWQTVNGGLNGAVIKRLVISPFYNVDRTVYAETDSSTFVSYNRGNNWQLLPVPGVTMLRVAPDDPTGMTLFARVGGYLARSGNGGQSWQTVLNVHNVEGFDFSTGYGVSDRTIYATVRQVLYVSHNGGNSWQPIQAINGDPTDFMPLYLDASPNFEQDKTVIAHNRGLALVDQPLWYSTDAAETWNPMPFPTVESPVIAFSPTFATDNTLFAAEENRLYKSTNMGGNWTLIHGNLPLEPQQIAISPNFAADGILILNERRVGSYRSANGGSSFQPFFTTVNEYVEDVDIVPGYPADDTVFLTASAGSTRHELYRVSNGGASWVELPVPGYRSYGYYIELSPNYDQDQTLFLANISGGLWRSTDRGDSWTSIPGVSFFSRQVQDVALSPNYANDQTLLVSINQQTLYISEDGGSSWRELPGVERNGTDALLVIDDGELTPLLTFYDLVLRYRWPDLMAPSLVCANVTGNAPAPYTIDTLLPLPSYVTVSWTTAETIPWLTLTPAAGELPAQPIIAYDFSGTTPPVSDSFMLDVFWSARQGERVTVAALSDCEIVHLPVVLRE